MVPGVTLTSSPKASYERWKKKISATVKVSILENRGISKRPDLKSSNVYVCSIKDVGPLAPTAQSTGKAIFDIEQEETREASSDGNKYYGAVWANWVDRMNDYKAEIMKIIKILP